MSEEQKDDVQPPAQDDPFGFQNAPVETTEDTGISAGAPASESEETPGVEGLMATGAAPDLDAEALRAAEEAVAKAEVALASAQLASGDRTPAPEAATKTSGRSEWALRAVLFANLILLGVMMALPNPDVPASEEKGPTTDSKVDGTTGTPQVAKDPAPQGAGIEIPLPASSPEYLQAIRLAAQDKHAEAAEVLRSYVTANPSLPARDKREYYSAMMFYYGEAGMHKERDASHSKLLALQSQSYLPEDILRFAREAEDEGDAVRMRQLYARFLLTQKNHSAEERRAVAEAYLKLGDSYRIQAERSKVRAMLVQRERESRLKLETRNRRAQQAGTDGGNK